MNKRSEIETHGMDGQLRFYCVPSIWKFGMPLFRNIVLPPPMCLHLVWSDLRSSPSVCKEMPAQPRAFLLKMLSGKTYDLACLTHRGHNVDFDDMIMFFNHTVTGCHNLQLNLEEKIKFWSMHIF